MTDQEAFTQIVQHLRAQGGPSVNEKGVCLYRHPDGIKRCAVGILIPDREYHPKLEGRFVESLPKISTLVGLNEKLLSSMQLEHDHSAVRSNWAAWMEGVYVRLAHQFNLIVPPHPCSTPVEVSEPATSLEVILVG